MIRQDWPRRRLILAASGPLLLAACAREQVAEGYRYNGPSLARPQRIFIPDLGVSADDVKLDQGVRARLMRDLSPVPAGDARLAAGREAAGAVTQEVVARLGGYGLPATRTGRPPPALPVPNVVVDGHVLSVDQGNRTRRTVVGFGAGQSHVVVEVQVYYRDASGQRLLEQFEIAAESPRTPGAAATMGAGAAAGRVVEAAVAGGIMRNVTEARSADTGAEGHRIGDALARRLGQFFAQMGWVSPSAIR